jgi:hypothetical protein
MIPSNFLLIYRLLLLHPLALREAIMTGWFESVL